MNKAGAVTCLLLLSISCAYYDGKVVDINSVEISAEVVSDIANEVGKPYQLFIRENWISDKAAGNVGMARTDTIRNGLFFPRIDEKTAISLRNRYKKREEFRNKYIFLSAATFTGSGLAYDVVIVSANNQFQVLKIMNTHGLRDGIGHDQIFEFITDLHDKNPLEIYHLEEDKISLTLDQAPDQRTKDAIAAICPNYELNRKDLQMYWPR